MNPNKARRHTALNLDCERTRQMAKRMVQVKAANAGRETCSICGMSISVGGMARHVDLIHGDD